MRSLNWGATALLGLSLLAPTVSMAAAEMPDPAAAQDPGLLGPAAPGAPNMTHRLPQVENSTGMGAAMASDQLEHFRGGSEVSNSIVSNGLLQGTTAVNVASGKNSITDGAFAHASGLPIVIQNSGANVLIQNSTVVNVEFK